jgi:CRP-like cAMP-binding protein
MSRHDIADYLGLTLETVSRAMSEFRRENILKFEGATHRHIVVLNVQALAELADEPASTSESVTLTYARRQHSGLSIFARA